MARDTSAKAYNSIYPKLGEKQKDVLRVIRRHPRGIALFELPDQLGWPINSISGRITELSEKKLIEICGEKVNPHTGRKAKLWRTIKTAY
jgi:DNA-binding MarR family transcriptional regulator